MDCWTTKNAQVAFDEGILHQWLQSFLWNSGACSLARVLDAGNPYYDAPKLLPLCGMKLAFADVDVADKIDSIKAGWDPPPLLLNGESKFLCDGYRRRQALIACGRDQHWMIAFHGVDTEGSGVTGDCTRGQGVGK